MVFHINGQIGNNAPLRYISTMGQHQQPTVDLLIPARNEQENIPALMDAVPKGQLRHIIVIDNGSTDQTASLARAAGAVVVSESQRGYGAACLAGLAWVEAQNDPPDMVAFIDADLADDPSLLPTLWEPIAQDTTDMVVGARRRLAQPGALTLPQRAGNAIACAMIRFTTGHRYTDLGPMRVVRWPSLMALNMADRTWGWTVEMQFKAARMGFRVMELDVPYRPRRAGVSKISGSLVGSVRAGWKILTTISTLWWQSSRCADGAIPTAHHRKAKRTNP